MSEESLFDFPCEFPIKVMGHSSDTLEAEIVTIVRQHVPDLAEGAVRSRSSGKGNYTALTLTINATSKAQLDDIYRSLNAHEAVVMTL
jgi:putative lipoic acid-binding regulatory protein